MLNFLRFPFTWWTPGQSQLTKDTNIPVPAFPEIPEKQGEMDGHQPLISGLPDDLALQCLARVPRACHPILRLVCSSWQHVVDSQDYYNMRLEAGASEEWFYVLTLFPLLKAFDPRAPKWHILPPMPGVLDSDLLIDCACVVVGHKLLVIGGLHIETRELKMVVRKEVLIYNALTNSWEVGEAMQTARRNFAYGVIGDCVYVAGGHNLLEGFLHTAEVYSLASNTWRSLEPLAPKRGPCIGAVINDQFCVLENCEGGSCSAEVLNSDHWSEVDGMVPTRGNSSRCIKAEDVAQCQRPLHGPIVLDGKLYAVARDRASIRVYSAETRQWSVIEMPPLPSELGYTIHGIAGHKNELYVIGLRSAKERSYGIHPLRTLHAYNPKTKAGCAPWRTVVSIEYTRRFHIGYVGFAIISV